MTAGAPCRPAVLAAVARRDVQILALAALRHADPRCEIRDREKSGPA